LTLRAALVLIAPTILLPPAAAQSNGFMVALARYLDARGRIVAAGGVGHFF